MESKRIFNIADAQKYISILYPNDDRDFSYIFGYAARHLGYLSKALNQERSNESEFVRTISWLLALANKLGIDIESALIGRHPGICPYCIETPCQCLLTGKRPANGFPAYKIPEELRYRADMLRRSEPTTFQSHADRISSIYPGNAHVWSAIGAWRHTSKMQEELAEVHEAATRSFRDGKSKVAVGEEFADLFAWILSAWRLVSSEDRLDDSFILFYSKGCPVCLSIDSCNCELFSDKSSMLVDPEIIDKVKELFTSLIDELDMNGDDIEPVIRSLKEAASSQSEPVARGALLEVKSMAEKAERTIESGAKNSKNASIIITSLKSLFESIPFI